MKLSNKQYDILKWIATTFLPLFIAFIAGLGKALNWESTELAVTILGLINSFLGGLLGVSSNKYNKDGE